MEDNRFLDPQAALTVVLLVKYPHPVEWISAMYTDVLKEKRKC